MRLVGRRIFVDLLGTSWSAGLSFAERQPSPARFPEVLRTRPRPAVGAVHHAGQEQVMDFCFDFAGTGRGHGIPASRSR